MNLDYEKNQIGVEMNLLIKQLNNRRIASLPAILFVASISLSCGGVSKVYAAEAAPNTLSEAEAAAGWILLFDGESSEGWRGYGRDDVPGSWQVVDGTLHMDRSRTGVSGAEDGGDIIYHQQFQNFRIKLDWKISEGGNSGIFYLGQEQADVGPIYWTAPEMQVLDNDRHPDARMGRDGNRKAGSLYDLIPAVPQNARAVGQWNEVEIMVYEGAIVHKQNGETVVEIQLGSSRWEELVAGSKFPGLNENWAKLATKGYIGLQDHGDEVWFRNLKILEL